mmetsp:Transcript_3953/g.6559  ORF Transcript_3953/g.6559 Transcript_3953/m.6559 type:complete len:233 (+) Transcript_3953:3-701(+)
MMLMVVVNLCVSGHAASPSKNARFQRGMPTSHSVRAFFSGGSAASSISAYYLGLLGWWLNSLLRWFFLAFFQELLFLFTFKEVLLLTLRKFVLLLFQYLSPFCCGHFFGLVFLRLLILIGFKVIASFYKGLCSALSAKLFNHLFNVVEFLPDTAHVDGAHDFLVGKIIREGKLVNKCLINIFALFQLLLHLLQSTLADVENVGTFNFLKTLIRRGHILNAAGQPGRVLALGR